MSNVPYFAGLDIKRAIYYAMNGKVSVGLRKTHAFTPYLYAAADLPSARKASIASMNHAAVSP